jgi:hypothetical protein
MSEIEHDLSLLQDSDFASPLERVNFAPGMLLGVEATQAEQAYHRRKLNRHRYWLHGAGTILGFAVSLQHSTEADPDKTVNIKLMVAPGVGIDGLGREVTSFEPYCLSLNDWIESQMDDALNTGNLSKGLNAEKTQISLLVTMRQSDCPSAFQPVMAKAVNAGSDAVTHSRNKECLLLEIQAAPLPQDEWQWGAHQPSDNFDSAQLTQTEQAYVDSLSDEQQALIQRQSALVYALPENSNALKSAGNPQTIARTLLAQLTIEIDASALPNIVTIINPKRVTLNNLVRPFVTSADARIWLSEKESV